MDSQNLWAPWRIRYIQGLDDGPPRDCFLCAAATAPSDDQTFEDRLILLHDERGMLLMNRYPYTNGHLMAAPAEHVGDLSELSPEQRHGLMDLTELANRLLRTAVNPQGVNVGMNLGRCAGAGVPGHAHMHIVPRWAGDVNFMDVVGHVRVIPQAVQESYRELREALRRIEPESSP